MTHRESSGDETRPYSMEGWLCQHPANDPSPFFPYHALNLEWGQRSSSVPRQPEAIEDGQAQVGSFYLLSEPSASRNSEIPKDSVETDYAVYEEPKWSSVHIPTLNDNLPVKIVPSSAKSTTGSLPDATGAPCKSTKSKSTVPTKRSRPKEGRKAYGSDEEDSDSRKSGIVKKKRAKESGPPIACPFAKHDGRPGHQCRMYFNSEIRRVKEHVHTTHLLHLKCSKCPFRTGRPNKLEEHEQQCQGKPPPRQKYLPLDQETLDRANAFAAVPRGSLNWERMYTILFPDTNKSDIPLPWWEDPEASYAGGTSTSSQNKREQASSFSPARRPSTSTIPSTAFTTSTIMSISTAPSTISIKVRDASTQTDIPEPIGNVRYHHRRPSEADEIPYHDPPYNYVNPQDLQNNPIDDPSTSDLEWEFLVTEQQSEGP